MDWSHKLWNHEFSKISGIASPSEVTLFISLFWAKKNFAYSVLAKKNCAGDKNCFFSFYSYCSVLDWYIHWIYSHATSLVHQEGINIRTLCLFMEYGTVRYDPVLIWNTSDPCLNCSEAILWSFSFFPLALRWRTYFFLDLTFKFRTTFFVYLCLFRIQNKLFWIQDY